MTTGRINQVSKIQSSVYSHQRLKITYELKIQYVIASCIKHDRTEFYFHHTFQAVTTTTRADTSRKPKLPDQAPNGFPLNAIGCETRNSSKVRIQILKHVATPKSCRLEKLYLLIRTCCFKRETNTNAKLKYFFNAKTYTSEFNCFRR